MNLAEAALVRIRARRAGLDVHALSLDELKRILEARDPKPETSPLPVEAPEKP